jgi:hypothetical protein
MLRDIARAAAATGPEHAERLIAEVEGLANSISDVPSKAEALSRIAHVIASSE